jgi:hypothetical protein
MLLYRLCRVVSELFAGISLFLFVRVLLRIFPQRSCSLVISLSVDSDMVIALLADVAHLHSATEFPLDGERKWNVCARGNKIMPYCQGNYVGYFAS